MPTKIIKNSVLVFLLIVLGKILSFFRDIITSSSFGSTFYADAYFAANNVPSIIFISILSSYIVLLIPTYKNIQVQSGNAAANKFVSRVINLFIAVSLLLSATGFFFIEQLIYLVAPGFDKATHEYSVFLGKILILSFPFSSVTLILSTISNANNKYFAPHIIPVFSALFVVTSVMLFAGKYGIVALAVSSVVAFVFQLIIQLLISRRDFTYSFETNLLDTNIKKMTVLVVPVFLGFSIDQVNLLVNSIMCSHLSEGSLSSLNYAQRLQATINGTLSTALITVLYPLISKLSAENNIARLNQIVRNGLKGMTLLLLPIVAFLAVYAVPFVSIIYFRGKFDQKALDQTSSLFVYYAVNILFLSLRELILRLYYINNNTKMPFVTSIISITTNIVLSIALVKFTGIEGLSLANLVATVVSTFILLAYLPTRAGINITPAVCISFFKQVFFPVAICIVLFVAERRLYHHNIFMFISFAILSIAQFFGLLLLFRQKDAIKTFQLLREKISYAF